MKFILWLFDFTGRHSGDVRRYERGGKVHRLFICIFLAALSVFVLWLEDWSFSLFDKNHLERFVGGLFAVLLFFCVWIATLDTCILYAYLGISRAVSGSLRKIIEKSEKKKARKKRGGTTESDYTQNSSAAEDSEAEGSEAESSEAESSEAPAKRKVPAWLDATVGIFSILIGCALTAAVIRTAIN